MAHGYPPPVRNRVVPSGGSAGAGSLLSIPRVRIWPFLVRANTGTGAWVASPKFNGPAVIESIFCSQSMGTTTAPNPTFTIFKALSNPGSAINQLVTAAPPGVAIFDAIARADYTADTWRNHQAYPAFGGFNRLEQLHVPLKLPAMESEFYLAMFLIAAAGQPNSVAGWVRVIEGLSAEDIPNFL